MDRKLQREQKLKIRININVGNAYGKTEDYSFIFLCKINNDDKQWEKKYK